MPTFPDRTPASPERIERLQRRRTRLMWVQALFFIIWQTSYFSSADHALNGARLVDHVKISAYVVWSLALLAFIATGGGYLQSREVRAVLNDETTIEHRRTAMVTGFWVSMLVAVGAYVVALFEPITAGEVIHAVLTAGIASAMMNFVALERRAQANG